MLLRNKGFYMAELVISLSGWILITGILLPMLIQMKQQCEILQQKRDALYVLYEYIQSVDINTEAENYQVVRGKTLYEIRWTSSLEEGKKEVFITYENTLGENVQIFELVQ